MAERTDGVVVLNADGRQLFEHLGVSASENASQAMVVNDAGIIVYNRDPALIGRKAPDAILQAQLVSWDKTIAKKSAENPLFKKVLDSQKAFAERAVRWQEDYTVDFKMAYNHYFGKKG